MNMTPNTILIHGGRLVDPASGIDAERDLLLRDGRVAAVDSPGKLKSLAKQEKAETIDATAIRN